MLGNQTSKKHVKNSTRNILKKKKTSKKNPKKKTSNKLKSNSKKIQLGGGIRGLFQFEDQPRLNPEFPPRKGDTTFENSFEDFIEIITDTTRFARLPENVLMTLTVEPENRVRHGYGQNRLFLEAKDYLFKIYNYDVQSENDLQYLLFCRNANTMSGWPKYNFAVVKIKKQEVNEDTKEWDEGWEQGKWVLEVDFTETNKIIGKYQGEDILKNMNESRLRDYLKDQNDSSFNTLFPTPVGTHVQLRGLQASRLPLPTTPGPELNGQRGVVKGFDTSTGRCSVHLKDGRGPYNIKPENLGLELALFNDPPITIPLRYKNKDTGNFVKPKNINLFPEFIIHLKKIELEQKIKKNNDRTFFEEIKNHNSMVDRSDFDLQLKSKLRISKLRISELSGL